MADLKKHLADLAALQSQSNADEKRILAAAELRHDELQRQIEAARAEVNRGVDGADQRYIAMTDELGRVSLVIGKARAALA